MKALRTILAIGLVVFATACYREAEGADKPTKKSKAVFLLHGGKHECKFFYGYFQEFDPYVVYIIMAPRKLTEKEQKAILAYEKPDTLKDSYWALVEIKFRPWNGKAKVSTISTDFCLKKRSASVNKVCRKQNDESFSLVGKMAVGETISFGCKAKIREEDRELMKEYEHRTLQFDFLVQCKLKRHPVKSLWDKHRGLDK